MARNGRANGAVTTERLQGNGSRPDWPASQVEMRPLKEIKPYPKNPRQHTPEQIALIAASMKADGVTAPILVDEDGIIIYGHGRRRAAEQNGYDVFPVVVARGWSEEKKRAVRVKDNQLAALSTWDMPLLRVEVAALKLDGYDMKLLGFNEQMTGWLTSGSLVTDPAGEWAGMPHFDNPDARSFRSIVVHFHDQAGVDAFAAATNQVINDKTRFLWYPEIEIKPFVKVATKASASRAK